MLDFTYNGVNSLDVGLYLLEPAQMGFLPSVETNIVEPGGGQGGYLLGSRLRPRVITMQVGLKSQTHEEARELVRTIAEWLAYGEPAPLILGDDPDRQYYAIVSGDSILSPLLTGRTATITFLCPDPYAYALEDTVVTLTEGSGTVTTLGTAITYPRITVPLEADTRLVSVASLTAPGIVVAGDQTGQDEAVTNARIRRAAWKGDSLTGWSEGTWSPSGVVAGTMATNGYTFSPAYAGGSWGTGGAWHGPSIRRAIGGAAIQNFELAMHFGFKTSPVAAQMGGIGVALLNANAEVVGSFILADAWTAMVDASASYVAGSHNYGYLRAGGWCDMPDGQGGRIVIRRVGTTWYGWIGRWVPEVNDYRWRATFTWNGTDTTSADAVAYIEIFIRQHSTYPVPSQVYFGSLFLDEIPGELEEATGFVDGDVLTIDNERCLFAVNDLASMHRMDISSDFWALRPGDNDVVISVSDGTAPDCELTFRDRWL